MTSVSGAQASRITVYVAHHRPTTAPPPAPPYVAVCNVTPDGRRPAGFEHYDDDGGLPERNTAYNELSVLHRLQQRADTDYVGLAHYRRVLLARQPRGRRGELTGTTHLPEWDWHHPERWAGDEAALLEALDAADWATAVPFDVRRAGYRNLSQHYIANHPAEPLRAAGAAIAHRCPDWEPLASYLHRETALLPYNIFLGRRELLDRYGACLWPVLADCESADLSGYQGRWAGFVAERLHGYWLDHVSGPLGLTVVRLPVGLIDVPAPARRQRLLGTLPPAVSRPLRRRLVHEDGAHKASE